MNVLTRKEGIPKSIHWPTAISREGVGSLAYDYYKKSPMMATLPLRAEFFRLSSSAASCGT